MAHWQDVLEREQKTTTSGSTISPVEEQIDENDDFLEEENLNENVKTTSESAIVRTANSSKSLSTSVQNETMLASNDTETFTNVIEKPFSPNFESLTAATYQTPKIYLTHTENSSNSDSTNNFTTSNSESLDSFSRRDDFSTSSSS